MSSVRLMQAKIDSDCDADWYPSTSGLGDYLEAVEYLAAMGADIIVVEFAQALDVASESYDATVFQKNNDETYEAFPDILFVLAGGNQMSDCSDDDVFCWPAETVATNTLRVAATGMDNAAANGEMNGLFYEPYYGLGSNYGLPLNIGAPGHIDLSGQSIYGLPTIMSGREPNYGQWKAAWDQQKMGYASGAIAITGGAAGLVLSMCPTLAGEDLANAILDGANTSPPVAIDVENGRYLSVDGAVAECSP